MGARRLHAGNGVEEVTPEEIALQIACALDCDDREMVAFIAQAIAAERVERDHERAARQVAESALNESLAMVNVQRGLVESESDARERLYRLWCDETQRAIIAEQERDEARDRLNARGQSGCPDLDMMRLAGQRDRALAKLAAAESQAAALRVALERYAGWHQSCADHHRDDCPRPFSCEACEIDRLVSLALAEAAPPAEEVVSCSDEALHRNIVATICTPPEQPRPVADAELDSPPFKSQAQAELEARGFERVNRVAACSECGGTELVYECKRCGGDGKVLA